MLSTLKDKKHQRCLCSIWISLTWCQNHNFILRSTTQPKRGSENNIMQQTNVWRCLSFLFLTAVNEPFLLLHPWFSKNFKSETWASAAVTCNWSACTVCKYNYSTDKTARMLSGLFSATLTSSWNTQTVIIIMYTCKMHVHGGEVEK